MQLHHVGLPTVLKGLNLLKNDRAPIWPSSLDLMSLRRVFFASKAAESQAIYIYAHQRQELGIQASDTRKGVPAIHFLLPGWEQGVCQEGVGMHGLASPLVGWTHA